jgi:hypothetical protein
MLSPVPHRLLAMALFVSLSTLGFKVLAEDSPESLEPVETRTLEETDPERLNGVPPNPMQDGPMQEGISEPGLGVPESAPEPGEEGAEQGMQTERPPLEIPTGMAAIEAFSAFVMDYERTERRGFEGQAQRYIYDGAIYMAHAVSALVPKGIPEFEARRDTLMRRAELLEDTRLNEDHILLVRGTLIEATELLGAIQERRYPAYETAVRELITTAQGIYPDRPLGHQRERIEQLYRETARLLMEMAGQPPRAVIAREDAPGEAGDDAIGGGPMMSEEVQRFVNFVDQGIEDGTFLNGEDAVYEALRMLTIALGTMLPSGDTVLFDQHRTIEQRVHSLELTHSAPGHGTSFRDTLHDIATLMTGIQQQRFPNLSASLRQVRDAAERIDADRDLAMQGERLESFFLNARRALVEMEERRQRQRGDW